ncbi:hypothetical protein C4D60_Mb11t16600 [Musa balbisiana]|uniref:non-specific serine/threonine protein kinase n=1 Tax=Musa balbisiana TaxID=52838 RepID=A0A4S8J655_MUSBA|nr:hypothetical protein C4D60_Mb11t16600 [Musa balbisiana]
MEKYEMVRDIGSGNFGVAKLMRHKETKELVAMKLIVMYIFWGGVEQIDENVAREIVNHRSLLHPNIIRFKEARYFFQQLISGVSYCHFRQICHRDLKLENTLLDGSPAPRLKICDFGYSKSSLLHSRPKSTVGTPAYIAPEVLSRREYDGKRIMSVQYKIPDYVHISQDCKQLISRIFVANPMKRITIREIKSHPWFLKNLPRELTEAAQAVFYRKDNNAPTYSTQKVDEIMKILTEARTPPKPSQPVPGTGGIEDEFEEEEGKEENQEEEQEEDDDDEYDKTVKAVHASGEF